MDWRHDEKGRAAAPDDKTAEVAWDKVWAAEQRRIDARRKALSLPSEVDHPSQTIGLSLSGGGVRSATFALGVMQALARCRMLECVDYLSTASGGGYAGAFFCSMFARRPNGGAAVTQPYDVMRGPCQRPQMPSPPQDGKPPAGWEFWWLRNSGRYLAPTGAGDYVYAVALALRNLVAVHYVLGATIVMATVLLIAIDSLLSVGWQFTPFASLAALRGSGIGLLAMAMMLIWVLPTGQAYFVTEMPKAAAYVPGARWWHSSARLIYLSVGLASLVLAVGLWWIAAHGPGTVGAVDEISLGLTRWSIGGFASSEIPAAIVFTIGLVLTLAIIALGLAAAGVEQGRYVPSARPGGPESSAQGKMLTTRVVLTKWLAAAMKASLAAIAAAIAIQVSFALVADGQRIWSRLLTMGGGGSALLVLIVKQVAGSLMRRGNAAPQPALSFDRLALALGVLFLAVLLVGWMSFTWAAVALIAGTGLRDVQCLVAPLAIVFMGVLLVGIITGRSFAFVNLTTIQNLYSSRLVRAYLGASNPARAIGDDARWTRISDTHPADNLTLDQYYGAGAAPLHIVNVTLNETVSPTDPLVQRDRHGRPLSLSPDAYCIDGHWWLRPDAQTSDQAEQQALLQQRAPETMAIGSWIGISGAAFSTGVGRGTTLGKSLLFGLSNVRLGYWWRAGWLTALQSKGHVDGGLRWLARVLQPQAYLLAELLGRYSGRYAPYWYLSDGGHFENTALYELLRRGVGLVVATDSGADPSYMQDDVANMMRLARIDLGCEFFQLSAAQVRAHDGVIGRLAEFMWVPERSGSGGDDDRQCLSLYWVHHGEPDEQGTALVVIKPRLVDDAPVDVKQYARVSPTFPQEATSDQFFDEQQWESYRQLGELIGSHLSLRGGDAPSANARPEFDAWQALRADIRRIARIEMGKTNGDANFSE